MTCDMTAVRPGSIPHDGLAQNCTHLQARGQLPQLPPHSSPRLIAGNAVGIQSFVQIRGGELVHDRFAVAVWGVVQAQMGGLGGCLQRTEG